jgi:hypothetical protein
LLFDVLVDEVEAVSSLPSLVVMARPGPEVLVVGLMSFPTVAEGVEVSVESRASSSCILIEVTELER